MASHGAHGIPRTLITTDVAAEGLDLQAAGRVVHYDLPWTEVRLEQRTGRAARRGSVRPEIEVVRFHPDVAVEARLHQLELLARKAGLPARHGLGTAGRLRWRWRREIADGLTGFGVRGICTVRSERSGALAGLALEREGVQVVSTVLWRDGERDWVEDPGLVEELLQEAAHAPAGQPPSRSAVEVLFASVVPTCRAWLREASAHRITGAPGSDTAQRLARRLRRLASGAASHRDADLLALLGRALGFCSGGHTAGEVMLIDAMERPDDACFFPHSPPPPLSRADTTPTEGDRRHRL